jgi:molybdate transport system substrate-binding protein
MRNFAVSSTRAFRASSWLVVILGALLITTLPVVAAEIRVYSGGAPQAALKLFALEFEQATGHKLVFTFGVVGAIRQRLASGEKADVILLPAPMIDAMDKAAALRPESRLVLARVGIGVVVRQGTALPDISKPEAVRKTLIDARSIAYPDPKVTPSGTHLTRVLAQLGIAEAVQSKTTLRNAIDGGVALIANGDVEIGVFLVSEVLPVRGVTLVGLLPSELQSYVVYAGAVAVDSASPEPALAFVRFLSNPAKREHWKAAGFESLSGAK